MSKAYPKSKQLKKAEKDEDTSSKLAVTSDHICRAILHWFRRHHPNCYVCVEIGVGAGSRRRVDAVLIRYSRGPIAFEVKTNRADWLRELANPGKHLEALDLTGQLYFISPPDVILPHEIPDGTGLYWVTPLSGKLKIKVRANRRPAAPPTWEQAAKLAAGVVRAIERGIT